MQKKQVEPKQKSQMTWKINWNDNDLIQRVVFNEETLQILKERTIRSIKKEK